MKTKRRKASDNKTKQKASKPIPDTAYFGDVRLADTYMQYFHSVFIERFMRRFLYIAFHSESQTIVVSFKGFDNESISVERKIEWQKIVDDLRGKMDNLYVVIDEMVQELDEKMRNPQPPRT